MTGSLASCTLICLPPPTSTTTTTTTTSTSSNFRPKIHFPGKVPPKPSTVLRKTPPLPFLYTIPLPFSALNGCGFHTHFSPKAAAYSSEYTEESATKVKFQISLSLPGCSCPLSLLGTGYREKVFAIIGVKVYAVGLYMSQSILSELDGWKGCLAQEIQGDSSLFDLIFQSSQEKSLHIVLVRDVDGKTFWDALDEAISPRLISPTPVDESALATFRSTFQGRSLKKGTFIFLTWLDSTKMLVAVSTDGLPSASDATIESTNVTSALFDVFFGSDPVSPSLKSSVANGLATMLK